MECLDANVVQDLMSGALDSQVRSAVLGHLDTCEDCRELLSITASDSANESLPRFHSLDGIGLDTTSIAEAPPSKPKATVKDAALLATQAASDPQIRVDDAATVVPGGIGPSGGRPRVQGKQLAHYTLIDRLGAGAMGVVWKAEDPKLGRQVAVKVLRQHDEQLTERLVREARSMAQVNDPHVVTVYDVGQAVDGTTYIAMELVSGQSLRAWQGKQKSIPKIIQAYISAGRGLAAAHAAGIVHRDFKPDNVLVGDDGRIRVTDFGLASAKPTPGVAPAQIGDVNLTTSGSVLGTPAYMAPEQFSGGNVDSRTDQFNFCVSLYEALYGERPFDGKTFEELGTNVTEGRIRQAPAGAQVSSAMRAILLRGLSVKPGDRFATMNELIVELGRDRARPWRRTAIALAALAVALLIGLFADRVVRARVGGEIRQSFALTRAQLDKTVARQTKSFLKLSEIADREPALREVAGHHDQADFGLGTEDADKADLEKLHGLLASTDWVRFDATQIAIGDYKGRLLFSTSSPTVWGGDLKVFDAVKRAIDSGKGDNVLVLAIADPRLVSSGIVSRDASKQGLGILFERTLALGDKSTQGSEARALYLQLQDGKQLLDDLQLDNEIGIALVAPDGTSISNDQLPHAVLTRARATPDLDEVLVDGHSYQVQSFPVRGLDETAPPIATVVMSRKLDGVLSLFPGARLVFALTAIGAILLACFTAWRARQITSGRS